MKAIRTMKWIMADAGLIWLGRDDDMVRRHPHRI